MLAEFAAWLEKLGGPVGAMPGRVMLCAAGAVGLIVLSLLLRGLQKVLTLAVIALIVLGGFWWVEDRMSRPDGVLPRDLSNELELLAAQALEDPAAIDAWRAVQRESAAAAGKVRDRLAAGGDGARVLIAGWIDQKAVELRSSGRKGAAEELVGLSAKVSPN